MIFNHKSMKQSIRLQITVPLVLSSGILAHAPYNSKRPVSFYWVGGFF
jgi:hypothetical protein